MRKARVSLGHFLLFLSICSCLKQHKLTDPTSNTRSAETTTIKSSAAYSDPRLLEKVKKQYESNSGSTQDGLGLVTPILKKGESSPVELGSSPDSRVPSPLTPHIDPEMRKEPTLTGDRPEPVLGEKGRGLALPESPAARSDSGHDPTVLADHLPEPPRAEPSGGDTLRIEYEGKSLSYFNGSVSRFNKDLQSVKIAKVEDIQFDPGEDSAFLVTSEDDSIAKNIMNSSNNSIVRGTTEFRILKNENEIVLIHALNVKPLENIKAVKLALSENKVFLPQVTFRSDVDFARKQDFIQAMGDSRVILVSHKTGTLFLKDNGETVKKFNYTVEAELGEGSFAQVYRVNVNDGGEESFDLAIKQPLETGNAADNSIDFSPVREIAFLDAMSRHPNGMQMYGAYPIAEGNYSIALEIIDGDWDDAVTEPFTFERKSRIIVGAADAFAALHAAQMVHYDTKLKNLFYSEDRGVLGDFGLARILKNPSVIPKVENHGTFVPFDLQDLGKIEKEGNPFAVDTFAFGISVLEMRLGRSVFPTIKTCCSSAASGREWFVVNGDELYNQLSKQLAKRVENVEERNLIKLMLSNDPTLRPPMSYVASKMREIYGLYNL